MKRKRILVDKEEPLETSSETAKWLEKKRQYAVDDYLSEVLRDKPDHPVHKRIKYRKEI
jgi:hypothetical protein